LKSCTECAELLRDLSSLQEMLRSSSGIVSRLEHQRARLALLRQTAAPSAKKGRAALLAAALVTLPLAVWAATSSLSPLRVWRTALSPTVESAQLTSSLGEKQSPSEPMPTASVAPSTATVDTSAIAKAILDTSSPVPLHASPAPLRALPNVSLDSTPSRLRRSSAASREKPAPAAPSAQVSQASLDFAEAMKVLSRGDFSASAAKLENFVSAHPRDPRVEEAVYLEAIALERAGRVSDAKAAARRYLAAYPDGAHDVQARRIAGD
jgi:TolA-binding protein